MANKKWSYIKNDHNRKCHTVVQGSLGTKVQWFWFKYHYELVEFYVVQCAGCRFFLRPQTVPFLVSRCPFKLAPVSF